MKMVREDTEAKNLCEINGTKQFHPFHQVLFFQVSQQELLSCCPGEDVVTAMAFFDQMSRNPGHDGPPFDKIQRSARNPFSRKSRLADWIKSRNKLEFRNR